MFLKKIKLAGFKSFVDPTTLNFPGKLSAVVGPNGSGKSNIIDAVSWVMGENSMKYLRGEVLTDVIFNGSTARKPVGQASIELVFDNQDGAIGGEYSNYAEISIKRVLTRDSDSTYYLNNSPCRRRDILDIFSGTGLGPRSYSIIGQNMVSRIVDSKPDDMRAYLEEAAGISKYKDRRRETELRIQHTKDNLARVNDLRSELDRQLTQLKRQASDAERYKTLKEQERLVKSQWYAMQWQQLNEQLTHYTLTIQQEETAQEGYQSEFTSIETMLEQKRQEQRTASDAFQDVQRRYYAVGNEIGRIEQDLVHQQERQQQLEGDLKQVDHDCQEACGQLEEVKDELQDLNQEILQLEPEWEQAVTSSRQAVQQLSQAERDSQAWQAKWDGFHQQTMKVSQQVEVEQAQIQHLQQKLQGIQQQLSKIQQEQSLLNFSQLDNEIQEFVKQLQETESQLEEYEAQFEQLKEQITTLQGERQHATIHLDQVRSELQKLRGKQASVEALQQAALGQRDNPALKWLTQHALDKNPRLAQGIEVEKGWELAVEKVLGPYLQAVCVDQLASVSKDLVNFTEGQLLAFACQGNQGVVGTRLQGSKNATKLLDKVTSTLPIHSILNEVYVAETQQEALDLLPTLEDSESVITREGIWFSPTWLRVSHDKDPTAGVLQREQELKHLHVSIIELEERQNELEDQLGHQQEKLSQLEQNRDLLQQTINQSHARLAEGVAQQKARQEKLSELKRKAEQLMREKEEYLQQEKQAAAELENRSETLATAKNIKEGFDSEREGLIAERENARTRLQEAREHTDQSKEQAHQLEIRLQSAKSQQGTLRQTFERMQTQLASLEERKQTLEKDLEQAQPLENLKETLANTLDKHLALEAELTTARVAMETLEQELDQLDKKRHQVEQNSNRLRSNLETLRLDSQSLKLKSESLVEHIKEIGFALEEALKDLPNEANIEEWQTQCEKLANKISRLGSINLIAVEEYATCQERKQYLDKQYEDLQASLMTLENAIAKIDRETRVRFKETFDKINERFKELFPLVFGGGHAALELTDENLLEAGVAVMACPPGKRNSSIHLLSGGEKSMTAIALIFSIFHLNPSPLCLLDEVDAALDDMNVSRFCDLVKKMSEKTQFVFISHNKLAIEMAHHLIGITMHEPGVSRLVSVDVEEAIRFATAS